MQLLVLQYDPTGNYPGDWLSLQCNAALVPPRVIEWCNDYCQWPGCDRVYWEGSHTCGDGWHVNAKRVYRLYDQEELKVRSVERKKISRRQRVPQSIAAAPNQCWSADFVSDKLADDRRYRILTGVDQFTRECVALEADRSMHGTHVTAAVTESEDRRMS